MKRFSTAALMSATAATAVLGVVAYAPLEADVRSAAFLGAVLSAGAGAFALVLKRVLLEKAGMPPAFVAMGISFLVRAVALAIGLPKVVATSPFGFVIAFFAVYAMQQTIELAWVVRSSKTLKGVSVT